MRSPLDPLPKAASLKAVVAVFALVVVGIGVTVGEYVRSTGPAMRSTVVESRNERARPNEVRAAAPRSCDRAYAPSSEPAAEGSQAALSRPTAGGGDASEPTMLTAPTADDGG